MSETVSPPPSRRAILKRGALCLAGLASGSMYSAETSKAPLFRVGLVTDLHYGDKPEHGTRFYREALRKLDEAVAFFNKEKPAFVVELGDFIDQADNLEMELQWLDTMEQHFAKLTMPRHYVLGNHCVGTLTKAEFSAHTSLGKTTHHSIQQQGLTFITLDACFREDGTPYERKNFDWKDSNIPAHELEWLKAELKAAQGPVVILAHQRLDKAAPHSVRNADAVREVLEASGKVVAVFQGHSHKNDYQQIKGIHYTTLVAMVEGSGLENNGYTLLDVFADGSLRLHGFRHQMSRDLTGNR